MEPVANQGSKPVDLNDVEMIGSPNHAKPTGPDVHMIANEKNHSIETFNDKSGVDEVETVPTQPLLEPDKEPQKPPLAGPESDDLEGDEKAGDNKTLISGIDDGLLDPEKKPDGIHGGNPDDPEKELVGDGATTEDDGTNGISSRAHFDDRPQSPMIGSIPDVNTYQQKKNLAQGMMDLALLSANANQLRYVLESSASHPYYYSSLTFISLSIILQIGVGIGLIMNSRYNVKDEKDICKADKINNMTVLGVFLITITNVFITSFSVATPNSTTTAVQTTDGSG
ncbi:ninjurin-A-like isoform X2 [Pectinophora gossypiella]|uniref:ninjurin-A-like isoform X2 n=1 Tax=Pectinophora gossypiella TaxID=13191 RepID=UPI00214F5919|nr:ninjurin-A-like isoform X2 [Pectinophora gossypiella]